MVDGWFGTAITKEAHQTGDSTTFWNLVTNASSSLVQKALGSSCLTNKVTSTDCYKISVNRVWDVQWSGSPSASTEHFSGFSTPYMPPHDTFMAPGGRLHVEEKSGSKGTGKAHRRDNATVEKILHDLPLMGPGPIIIPGGPLRPWEPKKEEMLCSNAPVSSKAQCQNGCATWSNLAGDGNTRSQAAVNAKFASGDAPDSRCCANPVNDETTHGWCYCKDAGDSSWMSCSEELRKQLRQQKEPNNESKNKPQKQVQKDDIAREEAAKKQKEECVPAKTSGCGVDDDCCGFKSGVVCHGVHSLSDVENKVGTCKPKHSCVATGSRGCGVDDDCCDFIKGVHGSVRVRDGAANCMGVHSVYQVKHKMGTCQVESSTSVNQAGMAANVTTKAAQEHLEAEAAQASQLDLTASAHETHFMLVATAILSGIIGSLATLVIKRRSQHCSIQQPALLA